MHPYHVEIFNQTDLYQLNDGRFQMIKSGPLDSVMVGFKYILVKNSIADTLKELDIDRVTFKPAIIWNRKNDTEDLSYTKMEVSHHFESENLNDIDIEGSQFLLLDNRYLFVSPELKVKLEASTLNWTFSKGFGNFG
tara:strand:+ start:560 stop:970 length:411 start_codon:yes stop_codon:yes gene_type:complete